MSKYEPLREHLARLDDVVWAAKLDEVEEILGSNLPRSAREHRTWWANSGGSLVHQNSWLDAGWRVERTDLNRDVIVFRRLRIGGTSLANHSNYGASAGRNPQKIAEKRLNREMASLRQPATVTLRSEWTVLGDVQKTPCSLSTIPADAGVVRFAAMDGEEVKTIIVATQSVQKLYRALRMGMKNMEDGAESRTGQLLMKKSGFEPNHPVECDIIKAGNAWLLTDGRGRKANLDDKMECQLVAQLLYVQELQSGRRCKILSV